MAARTHRFRSRLHYIQFACDAVFGPLDVHWSVVMFLDGERLTGQLFNVGIVDREPLSIGERRFFVADALTRLVRIDHANLL